MKGSGTLIIETDWVWVMYVEADAQSWRTSGSQTISDIKMWPNKTAASNLTTLSEVY